ncbi:TPA: hypothetical protein ACNCG7_004836, partial [Escherichia coli]
KKTNKPHCSKSTQASYKGSMSTLKASDNGLSDDLSTKNWITENGERGCNLLRGREALPAQPENRFQHVQEGGGGCTNS